MLRYYVIKRFGIELNFAKQFSASTVKNANLCGRDFIAPNSGTANDWKHVIWTAMDLKKKVEEVGGKSLCLLDSKHVSILMTKPSCRTQIAYSLACELLGARHTEYVDPDFELQPDCTDTGRALSRMTDVIVVNGVKQSNLVKVADGCSSPVIGACSNMFTLQKALADIMTILEKYKYLKGLTLAWIGPSSTLCNTYLCLLPLFGVNIRYCCLCSFGSGSMTPAKLEDAILAGRKTSTQLHQCEHAEETMNRAHIIATSMHVEEKYQITIKNIEEADFHWSFIHSLPRTQIEVTDDVFLHKNNITWLSSGNSLYVAMALILSTQLNYQPTIRKPDFDALEC